jgi:SAM-dependent methyltransferase
MDHAHFDKRGYPVVDAATGYGEWAGTYEATVAAGLDEPLLDGLQTIDWRTMRQVADLACGTGRTGARLAAKGVGAIDGVDIAAPMLALAETKKVYRSLQVGDIAATALAASRYDLCIMSLADEHLPELAPVYREAARLLVAGGRFVLLGYHPFFLMNGIPTHYHRADGGAVSISSHVHLFSEHHRAGLAAGLTLVEFNECVIDEEWLRAKPKWRPYLHWPVSFALVWRRSG